MMQVNTTINGNTRFVEVKSRLGHLTVKVERNESPAAALQRLAAENRAKAARLIAQAERCEAGADVLLTTAA